MKIWHKLWTSLLDLFFPKYCLVCRKENDWLCPSCQNKIIYLRTYSCPFCRAITTNGQTCLSCRSNHYLTGVLASCRYSLPIKKLTHQLKYRKTREISEILSATMVKNIKNRLPKGKIIITPVPLHPRRQKERGFNQADLLAKTIAKKLKLKYHPNLLQRTKYTKAQAKLSRWERIENLQDAFRLKQKDLDLTKYKILLVDDISTTGTTLNQGAKALRRANAQQIWGLVVSKR